ncbi:hypothetical protein BpHYR1_017106 [Brachionus plicatilis]|uniref:Uncharacterized protein n=1 Tax=Brachionus plicatilis TaxID=10195 RepID=A0A3M7PK09_BRAPC|nr:hypothetical protein BpHYR1_017106 [Brachionus plicatilis]
MVQSNLHSNNFKAKRTNVYYIYFLNGFEKLNSFHRLSLKSGIRNAEYGILWPKFRQKNRKKNFIIPLNEIPLTDKTILFANPTFTFSSSMIFTYFGFSLQLEKKVTSFELSTAAIYKGVLKSGILELSTKTSTYSFERLVIISNFIQKVYMMLKRYLLCEFKIKKKFFSLHG